MQWSDLKWSDVMSMVTILGLLLGLYMTVTNARKTAREEAARRARPMEDVRQMLANDKARLDNHEQAIKRLSEHDAQQDEQMRLMLRGQLALLRHGVDGNNIQGLRDSQKDIQDYLVDK